MHLRLLVGQAGDPHPMKVGKEFEGMEVKVLMGEWKGYFGTITSTIAERNLINIRLEGTSVHNRITSLRPEQVLERL